MFNQYQDSINQCYSYVLENLLQGADEIWRWVYAKSKSAISKIVRLAAALFELHNRKQVEEALRQSKATNDSIINAIPDLIYRLNKEGIFLDYFPPKDDKNAQSPEAFIGKSIEEVLSEDMAAWTRHFLEQTLATGQTQSGEYTLPINGTWQHYEARYVPCGQNEVLAIVRDLTERKRMEAALRLSEVREREKAFQLEHALRELQKTQSQLIQAEKMSALGSMVAGIAHEINNPVSFIYGNINHAYEYIQDLLKLMRLYQKHCPELCPEIQEEIESIDLEFMLTDMPKLLSSMKMGAERIREIVLSLRNFSRLDEGEKKLVDIHEGIDNTLLILQHKLKRKADQPEIHVIKEYGELTKIECYAGLLNQVFMNILSNAIDALQEQARWQIGKHKNTGSEVPSSQFPSLNCEFPTPTIKIRTEVSRPGYLTVRISDNGPGIRPEVQTRLFDPFFTTKPVGKGTGLGLSISYSIVVEKHCGQLLCCSELGKGTEFVIEIPLK